MRFKHFLYLLRSDFHRYMGRPRLFAVLKHWLVTPGVKYSFYMRLCAFLRAAPFKGFGMFFLARLALHHCRIKYGIDIPDTTSIGSGFYIGHFGGIVVNSKSIIGKNCNISHGVTLGRLNRGDRAGCPVIGDNVFIGPGAKILGNVRVGDHAAIGANCVVTSDVPAYAVFAGIPGKAVSQEGSTGYINNIDYE